MKDYNLEVDIEFVIHLADIHINNEDGGVISRKDEYESVFTNLIIDIKNNTKTKKNNTIIYIAGDIFDAARREKGRTTSTAVALFKGLLYKLCKLGLVVIIPGNHDNNITYKSIEDDTITDTLTGVLEGMKGINNSIFYLKDSGIYKIGNCIFYHTSVFDIDCRTGASIDKYNERLSFLQKKLFNYDNCFHIGALHCGIEKQQLTNGYILKDCTYKLDDLKQYDFTMLGDNHKYQYLDLEQTIGYPGSLIQQNHGEYINNHGYILWNLNKKTNDYHEIPNDYGFITININQDTDIDTIDFPRNSRVKLIYNIKQDNIELIKESIKLKTNVVNWNEKKILNQNSSEVTIDNNLNDIEIFTSYLKTKYPENSKQYTFIYNKIDNLLHSRKLGNGNSSWIFNKLIVENFQIYKGRHTLLDLENHPKNTIISILGENTHGKSTILRALSYVIWGKDILNLEEYINNESKKSKCILEFIYCNQKYKITRELNIKKEIANETLKFEEFIDNVWINKTGSQKNHTKNELIMVFGERDDAKSTWLSCQNSSVNFLNDTHNINIFSKLIGINLFKNECEIQQGIAKKKAIELNVKKTAMNSINLNFSDNLEDQIDTLELKQKTLTENNLILEKIIEEERTKEKFGTCQDYNEWNQALRNKTIEIEGLKLNLLDTTQIDILQKEIDSYYNEKDILLSKKTPIDINLDTLSTKIQEYTNKIHHFIESKINLEYKLKSLEHINKEDYEDSISEISLLEDKMKTLQKNKNDIVNMEKEKKTIEMENNKINISELESSNSSLEKQIEDIKTTILKNQGFLNGFNMDTFNQDKVKLNSISIKLDKLQQRKHNKLVTIKNLNNTLINIECDEVTIDNHLSKLKSMEKSLLVEENNTTNLDDIINRNEVELFKHKRLEFDDNCKSCTSNKQYFKIDIFEHNSIENNSKKELLNSNISKLKNDIDNLRWVEQTKLDFIKNNDTHQQLITESNELENIEEQLSTVQELFSNINSKLDSYKLKENTKIENDKLIKKLEKKNTKLKNKQSKLTTYQSNIDKLEVINSHIKSIYVSDTELITNQNSLEKLRHKQYIFNERIKIQKNLDDTLTNINTTNMEIDTYNKDIDIIKSNTNIENDIKIIEQLILTNKLDLERMLDVQTIEKEIITINTKINGYQHYNPKLIQQNDIERKDNYNTILYLVGQISNIKKDIDIYNYNKQKYDSLNKEFNTIDKEFNLLSEYIKILEEYPQNLMDEYLTIFETKVNDFISFSGFDYTTRFQRPIIKKRHKNNKHKFIITHQKNKKHFSTLSGAEQFTFNLAIITSLGCISNTTKSPILAIDEGFSCLDTKHINDIKNVLEYIKTQFHYIINISHIESIHQYANTKISINNGTIESI